MTVQEELIRAEAQLARLTKTNLEFRDGQRVNVTVGNAEDIKRYSNLVAELKKKLVEPQNSSIIQTSRPLNSTDIQTGIQTTQTNISPLIIIGGLIVAAFLFK